MKFSLLLRAYAPFETFGGGFHGDNRGPTARLDVTSRIRAWVDFNPITGEVGQPGAESDPSSHLFEMLGRATGIPTARVDAVKQNKGCLHFRLSTSGANPLVKPAPPIDMRASLTVSVSKEHLNIHGELTGDLFPNSEVLLLDQARTTRMIHSYETDGGRNTGPARLYKKGYERMSGICLSLPIDKSGRFV